MHFSLFHFLSLASLLSLVAAQQCSSSQSCPATAPCCSEYGYCGSGSYCLGGCEPLYSHNFTSCLPNPICVSGYTDFTAGVASIQQNATLYNGNASSYDWVVNTGTVHQSTDGLRLLLTQNNSGTKISSTRYLHYGTIDFVLETSKWAGVVTAAITMSDVKDEIDLEWPGNNTAAVQTNYWFLGIANYSATEGAAAPVDSDTSANFHTYTLDWQESYLNWMVDGAVVRTLLKEDTLADGQYKYPSTPSQIQISIWPAGISSEAQGTIDWAGGLIDWQDPDYLVNAYFWNTVQSVNITCAAGSVQNNSVTGWVYAGNDSTGVPMVQDTTLATYLSGSGPRWSSELAATGFAFIIMGLLSLT